MGSMVGINKIVVDFKKNRPEYQSERLTAAVDDRDPF